MPSKIFSLSEFLRTYIGAKVLPHTSEGFLRKYQQKRFNSFSHKWLSQSTFYRPYVGRALKDFPLVNKKIHMDNFNAINTAHLDRERTFEIAIESEKNRDFAPKYGEYSVGLSSGTTGSRGLFVTSDTERAQWAGAILSKMLPGGLKKKKVAFFLRANNNLYETVKNPFLEFMFYDMMISVSDHIEKLNKQSPTVLIAPAQLLKKLAQNGDLTINPTKVISVAEVLDDKDKAIIEGRFCQKVHQVYQCTEGFIASTCKRGNLHINEDLVIMEREWLTEDRFVPIITDYRRTTQPIIRYRLDDILVRSDRKCGCGSSFAMIEKIEGRCDDILQFPRTDGSSRDIYPDFIRNRIIATGQIDDYAVIQVAPLKLVIEISPLNQTNRDYVKSTLNDLWQAEKIEIPEYSFKEISIKSITEKKRRVRNEL